MKKHSFSLRNWTSTYSRCMGLLFFLILSWSGTAHAQKTWTGAISDNWAVAGNWNPAGVPGTADKVTISFLGSGGVYPRIYSGTAAKTGQVVVELGASLTIDEGGSLEISTTEFSGMAVTGTVTNGGIIRVKKADFHLLDNAGTFTNSNGASIYLGETTSSPYACKEEGIRNDQNGVFKNEGADAVIIIYNVGNNGILLSFGNNTFENSGVINIFNTGMNPATKNTADGVDVRSGTFTNLSTGSVSIYRAAANGWYCRGGRTTNNYGTINIFRTGVLATEEDLREGMSNYGFINNYAGGEINIDSTGNSGIFNNGFVENRGEINIGTSYTNSIESAGMVNITVFYNRAGAALHIKNTKSDGFANFGLGGTLLNEPAAEITIDNVLGDGFSHAGLTSLDNRGKLQIGKNGPIGNYGFNCLTNVVNQFSGEITIENTGSDALRIDTIIFPDRCQFINAGYLQIGNSNSSSSNIPGINIKEAVTFSNVGCGVIESYQKILNADTLLNEAFMYLLGTAAHSNTGDWINNGVIQDGNNKLNGVSVTNNDIIIKPVTGECVVANALQKGAGNNVTVAGTWHKNTGLSDPAGTYSTANNQFTISGLSEGTHTLYFSATDNEYGCAKTFSIPLTYNDVTKPTVTCPDPITVEANSQCGGAVPNVIPSVTKSDNCSNNITLSQLPIAGTALSGHNDVETVVVTANDNNGNTNTCNVKITLKDVTPPAMTCPDHVTVNVNLANPCRAQVYNIDVAYVENCSVSGINHYGEGDTEIPNTQGQASGTIFNVGTTTMAYSVVDGAGNYYTCFFTVTVNPCVTLEGSIAWSTDTGQGVKDATVNVTGDGSGSGMSDANGDYSIVLVNGGNIMLKPVKNINKFNGVTAADAARIQQHITGAGPLGAPFPRIAADVNKSNSITTADANLITQALLGSHGANNIWNTSWRFVDADYVFPNPNAPWNFPESVSIPNAEGDITGIDFIGIKLGDVATPWANPQQRPQPVALRAPDRVLQAGDRVDVVFAVDGYTDVAALQFVLRFDPEKLAFGSIHTPPGGPLADEHFGVAQAQQGELRVVLARPQGETLPDGTAFFTLQFTATASGDLLSSLLTLDEALMPALAYTTDLYPQPVQLAFTQASTSATDVARENLTLGARPNPASGQTTLRFYLPVAADLQLRLLDAQGRLVSVHSDYFQAGTFEQRVELPMAGLYFAELVTPYGTVTCKVIGE
ncbi:MAG: HYR domain-containing protein [Saprospiraceae bacterium]|nr:HYR domain-containing protein [Saprospiraceae bacterium]